MAAAWAEWRTQDRTYHSLPFTHKQQWVETDDIYIAHERLLDTLDKAKASVTPTIPAATTCNEHDITVYHPEKMLGMHQLK